MDSTDLSVGAQQDLRSDLHLTKAEPKIIQTIL